MLATSCLLVSTGQAGGEPAKANRIVTFLRTRSTSGPAKRPCRLTTSGRTWAQRWVAALRAFDAAVAELLRMVQAVCRPSARKRDPLCPVRNMIVWQI